ncbi:MAG TPA: TonB-dependent siderophore receptor [Burkholderiales bacterium]|nr:TonB-dependent siderophore receptor [Burkholderiales bacterium]
MHKEPKRWRKRPLALLSAALLASVAGAQEPQSAQVLPTIHVTAEQETATSPVDGYAAKRSATATKTDTPLSETPQSVSIVTRQRIEDQGATSLQDALNYSAGVRSDAYGLDSRTDSVRVRGAYPAEYTDGLRRQLTGYYTSNARVDPYALERIEVLRGPSSMLYGQGSTGGIINMVSKRPLAERQGEIGVQYGSFDRKQVQADFTGPLTEDGQWLYRFVSVVRDADTQVDYVEDDRKLFAPSLTWRPNGVTSLTIQALWQDDHSGSTSQFFPWSGTLLPNPNGRIDSDTFIGDPDDHYDSRRAEIGYLFEHALNDDWTVRQNLRYSYNKVDYASLYANSFGPPVGGFPGPDQATLERFAYFEKRKTRVFNVDQHLEGKFESGNVRHQFITGLDFVTHRESSKSAFALAPPINVYDPVLIDFPTPPLVESPHSKFRQTGIYLQDQMYLGDHWIVVAGLRRDWANNRSEGGQEQEDAATTGRLGVMYKLGGGLTPYVSYSESFTPVAGNASAAGGFYKPVEGKQLEYGVKYEPPGQRMSYNASVYRLKEENVLVNDPNDPSNPFQVQAGKTINEGLELEAIGKLLPWLDIAAHYNYIDIDKDLEGIPKHQFAVWGSSRFAIGDMPGFKAGLGMRFFSSFRDRQGGTEGPDVDRVRLFDAMLGYEHGHWNYTLTVQNITDEIYFSTCLSRGDCWFGARRTAVLTAAYEF